MYKYLLPFLLCFSFFTSASAQQAKLTKTTIAPFKITLVDGKTFTYKQLDKDKPTILIYFSPTCEHCKVFTEAMLKRKGELSNKQIVMVTYLPVSEIKKFDDELHISSNPNIKIGTEGYSFIVQQYYNVQSFPFVVEYDKTGKLDKVVPYNKQSEEMASQL